jgi:hypothetical protein
VHRQASHNITFGDTWGDEMTDIGEAFPKIVAAAEVCLNNALKGNLRSFAKAMEIAEKFGVLKPGSIQQNITHITRTIVDPRDPDKAREK